MQLVYHVPESSERGWRMREEFIFIVKADGLRKWKGSMEEPERDTEMPSILVCTRPTAHENYSKSFFTYALTVDASKMSSIDSQLEPHCSIFFNKEDWKCECSISSVFANGCVQCKTLPATNPILVNMLRSTGHTSKTITFLSEVWSDALTRSVPPPHIIREGAFFGYILSTPKSVNSFF